MASESSEVRLLGKWASPFSNRVDLALKLKGVSYKYSEENLANKSEDLLKYNPVHKKVPVLIHNGNPLAESLVVVEYIDDTWKNNPFLPQDPYERALAHFWAKTLDDKVSKSCSLYISVPLFDSCIFRLCSVLQNQIAILRSYFMQFNNFL